MLPRQQITDWHTSAVRKHPHMQQIASGMHVEFQHSAS